MMEPHGFFNQKNHDNRHYYETVRQADRFLVLLGYLSGSQTIEPAPPQLVNNGTFTRGLEYWSAARGTNLRLIHQPVHDKPRAASLSANCGHTGLWQDITAGLESHGTGEYYFGAWISTGDETNSSVTIRIVVENTSIPGRCYYALPTEVVSGKHFAHVSGTRSITWDDISKAARLEIMIGSGNAYVDNTSIEFLP